jgi:hypothetical protein
MVAHSHSPKPVGSEVMEWRNVITAVARRGQRRTAALLVDQDHPYFFDHPLDHVSGMLMVTGLLELVRSSADPSLGTRAGRRLRFSLKFLKFCELDRRVLLIAEPTPEGGEAAWMVRAVQEGHPVCEGTVELVDEVEVLPRWPVDSDQVPPIAARLTHRADPRNVVLGQPGISPDSYDVPLLSPPAGHFLRRHGDERYGVDEIIEAGRQLLTAATHLAHDQPSDTRLVWIVLIADLPAGPVRSVPLALRWAIQPLRGNTGVFDFSVVARGTSRPLGSLRYVTKALTPEAYRELRENGK